MGVGFFYFYCHYLSSFVSPCFSFFPLLLPPVFLFLMKIGGLRRSMIWPRLLLTSLFLFASPLSFFSPYYLNLFLHFPMFLLPPHSSPPSKEHLKKGATMIKSLVTPLTHFFFPMWFFFISSSFLGFLGGGVGRYFVLRLTP